MYLKNWLVDIILKFLLESVILEFPLYLRDLMIDHKIIGRWYPYCKEGDKVI